MDRLVGLRAVAVAARLARRAWIFLASRRSVAESFARRALISLSRAAVACQDIMMGSTHLLLTTEAAREAR